MYIILCHHFIAVQFPIHLTLLVQTAQQTGRANVSGQAANKMSHDQSILHVHAKDGNQPLAGAPVVKMSDAELTADRVVAVSASGAPPPPPIVTSGLLLLVPAAVATKPRPAVSISKGTIPVAVEDKLSATDMKLFSRRSETASICDAAKHNTRFSTACAAATASRKSSIHHKMSVKTFSKCMVR